MAAKSDAGSVDRIATKQTVTQIWGWKRAMNSRVGEERAQYGVKLTDAVEKKHLDKKAFDMATALAKLEPSKAAFHFRNLMIYCEHLGVGDQADLEDYARSHAGEGANPVEEATTKKGDGFDQGKGIKPGSAVTTANPEKALAAFKKDLDKAKQARSCQTILQKFVAHHQDLAEAAERMTETRVTELAGGKKKPASPATQAARDAGIGSAP